MSDQRAAVRVGGEVCRYIQTGVYYRSVSSKAFRDFNLSSHSRDFMPVGRRTLRKGRLAERLRHREEGHGT
jgi:hypothetical protein